MLLWGLAAHPADDCARMSADCCWRRTARRASVTTAVRIALGASRKQRLLTHALMESIAPWAARRRGRASPRLRRCAIVLPAAAHWGPAAKTTRLASRRTLTIAPLRSCPSPVGSASSSALFLHGFASACPCRNRPLRTWHFNQRIEHAQPCSLPGFADSPHARPCLVENRPSCCAPSPRLRHTDPGFDVDHLVSLFRSFPKIGRPKRAYRVHVSSGSSRRTSCKRVQQVARRVRGGPGLARRSSS